MYKGLKARPHDLDEVMKMEPELIEIHASSEDLEKNIDKKYDVKLAVHLPEYDGSELLDPASDDERERLKAVKFYNNALNKSREWGKNFRGLPTKVILHPGGWSIEPMKKYERKGLYDNLYRTIQDLNTADIDLLIENMPTFPWFYGGRWHCNIFMDPKECRDYALGWGVGICADICHSSLYCNHVKEIDPVDSGMRSGAGPPDYLVGGPGAAVPGDDEKASDRRQTDPFRNGDTGRTFGFQTH